MGREQVELTATQPIHLPVLSVQSFWLQALAVAQEWHPDAYVSGVRVDVPLPTRKVYPEGYPSVRFSFQSPGENYVTLVILCNAEKCHSFEVEQNPQYPLEQCTPINLNDFTLDSGEVVDIGLEYGGEDYINLPTADVDLMLFRDIPSCSGQVKWRISFTDFATRKEVALVIDAVTGEVIEVRE